MTALGKSRLTRAQRLSIISITPCAFVCKLPNQRVRFHLRHSATVTMPRKCSVGYCKSNYDSTAEKITVHGFRSDRNEQQLWLDALPNRIAKVTRYIGVCAKHWPEDTTLVKTTRFSRPRDPPTIFPNCPSSVSLSAPPPSRNVQSRKVDSASRSAIPDEWEEFRRKDKIESWNHFMDNMSTSDLISSNNLCVTYSPFQKELHTKKFANFDFISRP